MVYCDMTSKEFYVMSTVDFPLFIVNNLVHVGTCVLISGRSSDLYQESRVRQ